MGTTSLAFTCIFLQSDAKVNQDKLLTVRIFSVMKSKQV